MTKRVGVVVIFLTRLRDMVGSDLGWDAPVLTKISRNILQSLQTDAGLYPSFLPNPFNV
jgi:hypothetical protein